MSSPIDPTIVDHASGHSDSESDIDPEVFAPEVESPVPARPPNSKRYSKSDANSIVGGQSVELGETLPRRRLPFLESQKVFTFSLPFGGLSNIRNNLYKQILHFNLPNLPTLSFNKPEELDDIRLKLERQETVSTIDEARYFQHIKHTDDLRLRAVRHSLNEMLPDFRTKREVWHDDVFSAIGGNVVILGGYRGSILRDARTGKRVWIPLKAGFHLRKINLLLGPTREDELRAADYIYPDGVLKNIGPIDICKKLIRKLEAGPNNVHEFGYDWRLNLDLVLHQLEDFLDELHQKTGKNTLVIAHSMGGLVAHGTLQRRPELFRGLVYVGVPSECLNILGPIRFGDSVILSDKILTFETNFMMRLGFCFLPLSGRAFYNKQTHEAYELDFFDPETWVEYNLNPLVASKRRDEHPPALTPISVNSISSRLKNYRAITRRVRTGSFQDSSDSSPSTLPKPGSPKPALPTMPKLPSNIPKPNPEQPLSFSFDEAYEYLSDALRMAKEYVLGLDFCPDVAYPPLAVVYGNKVPSVRGSHVTSRQDIKDGNYYEFFYGHGDGVVHQRWLMPEDKGFTKYDPNSGKGHIVAKVASDAGHVNLMTDYDAMAKAIAAILAAEKKWARSPRSTSP